MNGSSERLYAEPSPEERMAKSNCLELVKDIMSLFRRELYRSALAFWQEPCSSGSLRHSCMSWLLQRSKQTRQPAVRTRRRKFQQSLRRRNRQSPPSTKANRPDNRPAAATPTPVYKPPLGLGAPSSLVAGGSRGTNTCLAGGFKDGNTTLTLSVLVPADHVGLTVQEQPSLYWYLSAATSCQVEVTLTDGQAVEPLLDLRLSPPANPGVQRVRLADHGVRLAPGVQYQWAVALVPDPNHRSKDIVAAGGIKRIEATEALQAKLAQAEQDGSCRHLCRGRSVV